MSMLLKEAVAHESLLGVAIRPHLQKKTKSRHNEKNFNLFKN